MNSKERVARAMRHALPDRVPVMCQLALGHIFLNAGLPPHRVWFTSEGFAEALLAARTLPLRRHLINIPGRDPPGWTMSPHRTNRRGECSPGKTACACASPRTTAQLEPDRPEHAAFGLADLIPTKTRPAGRVAALHLGHHHTPSWRVKRPAAGRAAGLLYRTIDLVAMPGTRFDYEIFSPFRLHGTAGYQRRC
jgi:hypothetical protein